MASSARTDRRASCRQEWPRLYQLLSQAPMAVDDPLCPMDPGAAAAVKALITGQNLERAEQYSDAAAAYRVGTASLTAVRPPAPTSVA